MNISRPGRTPSIIHRTESSDALNYLRKMVITGEKHEQDLNSIRATLYVNFVNKTTDGVKISKEDYEKVSTHGLILRVLQAYAHQLKQLSPVKDAQ